MLSPSHSTPRFTPHPGEGVGGRVCVAAPPVTGTDEATTRSRQVTARKGCDALAAFVPARAVMTLR